MSGHLTRIAQRYESPARNATEENDKNFSCCRIQPGSLRWLLVLSLPRASQQSLSRESLRGFQRKYLPLNQAYGVSFCISSCSRGRTGVVIPHASSEKYEAFLFFGQSHFSTMLCMLGLLYHRFKIRKQHGFRWSPIRKAWLPAMLLPPIGN